MGDKGLTYMGDKGLTYMGAKDLTDHWKKGRRSELLELFDKNNPMKKKPGPIFSKDPEKKKQEIASSVRWGKYSLGKKPFNLPRYVNAEETITLGGGSKRKRKNKRTKYKSRKKRGSKRRRKNRRRRTRRYRRKK